MMMGSGAQSRAPAPALMGPGHAANNSRSFGTGNPRTGTARQTGGLHRLLFFEHSRPEPFTGRAENVPGIDKVVPGNTG